MAAREDEDPEIDIKNEPLWEDEEEQDDESMDLTAASQFVIKDPRSLDPNVFSNFIEDDLKTESPDPTAAPEADPLELENLTPTSQSLETEQSSVCSDLNFDVVPIVTAKVEPQILFCSRCTVCITFNGLAEHKMSSVLCETCLECDRIPPQRITRSRGANRLSDFFSPAPRPYQQRLSARKCRENNQDFDMKNKLNDFKEGPSTLQENKKTTYHDQKVLQSKNNNPPLMCALCFRSYGTKALMVHHLKRFHLDPEAIHKGENKSTGLTCAHCGKRFTMRSNLCRHLKHVHGSSSRPQPCPVCGVSTRALRQHLSVCHPKTDPIRPYDCTECDKSYARSENLRRHQVDTHGFSTSSQRRSYNSTPQTCPVCQRVLKNLRSLRDHMRNYHSGKLLSKKTEADRAAAPKNSESSQQRIAKPGEAKRLTCDFCLNTFINKKQVIQVHIWRYHILGREKLELERVKCTTCGRTFSCKGDLNRHVKNLHGPDAKPRACTICGSVLKNANTMRKHVYNHKKKDQKGNKFAPFNCPTCKKSFTTARFLTKHISDFHWACVQCFEHGNKKCSC